MVALSKVQCEKDAREALANKVPPLESVRTFAKVGTVLPLHTNISSDNTWIRAFQTPFNEAAEVDRESLKDQKVKRQIGWVTAVFDPALQREVLRSEAVKNLFYISRRFGTIPQTPSWLHDRLEI